MSCQFGPAQAGEIPALKALWRQAFHDDDACIDAFFKTVYHQDTALVIREDGQVQAMAFWLPMTVCYQKRGWPAAYLYAVATDQAARGRGLCSRLLEDAAAFLAPRGCRALLLVPGEPSLRDFYGARGYSDFSSVEQLEFSCVSTEGQAEAVPPPVYLELREALLADTAYVSCPVPVLAYQEASIRPGGLFRLRRGALEGCACVELDGHGGAVIHELLWPGDPQEGAALAAQALGASRARVRLPGGGVPFAMVRWLTQPPELPPVYFGLDLG